MAIVFVAVGSFILGACVYVFWRASLKRVYVSFFKAKQIQECKERLRQIDFFGIPTNKRVETYLSDEKIQSFDTTIITEAERLYFKQKQFDDLVEYISNFEFSFEEIFIRRFKNFRTLYKIKKLNKNQEIVKTLIEHNWKEKTIIRAFKILERGQKQNGKPRKQPSFPKFKGQIEQDFEESTSSNPGTIPRGDTGASPRGTPTSSNDSGTNPIIQGEFAQRGKFQNGNITPKGESTQRNKKYFN